MAQRIKDKPTPLQSKSEPSSPVRTALSLMGSTPPRDVLDDEDDWTEPDTQAPVGAEYTAEKMQEFIDRRQVTKEWALTHSANPERLRFRSPSPEQSGRASQEVPRPTTRTPSPELPYPHPTPSRAVPRRVPSTEPTRRQSLVLNEQERQAVMHMRQYHQDIMDSWMDVLTETSTAANKVKVQKSILEREVKRLRAELEEKGLEEDGKGKKKARF
ncbi:hypothetical protein NMY22_g316 [Coprinellus aureogranulatus]|nr:hypothetical protein NMY22_g316 [Coprinellus aureogranulatus]